MRACAILPECTQARCVRGDFTRYTIPTLGDSYRQNTKANIKSPSLTSLLPGLSAWLFGGFLLAAIDQAEGHEIWVS